MFLRFQVIFSGQNEQVQTKFANLAAKSQPLFGRERKVGTDIFFSEKQHYHSHYFPQITQQMEPIFLQPTPCYNHHSHYAFQQQFFLLCSKEMDGLHSPILSPVRSSWVKYQANQAIFSYPSSRIQIPCPWVEDTQQTFEN